MRIDNIKNYIHDEHSFNKLADEIYSFTSNLKNTYPDYKKWFYEKQLKGCLTPERNIIFVRDNNNQIIAVSSLKKTLEEKKICTLLVLNEYRSKGVGSLLLEESFNFLETDKPLITFSEDALPMYEKIIEKYDWELTEIVYDMYGPGTKEYSFNGQLSNRNYRQEFINVLKGIKSKANLELKEQDKIEKISIKK